MASARPAVSDVGTGVDVRSGRVASQPALPLPQSGVAADTVGPLPGDATARRHLPPRRAAGAMQAGRGADSAGAAADADDSVAVLRSHDRPGTDARHRHTGSAARSHSPGDVEAALSPTPPRRRVGGGGGSVAAGSGRRGKCANVVRRADTRAARVFVTVLLVAAAGVLATWWVMLTHTATTDALVRAAQRFDDAADAAAAMAAAEASMAELAHKTALQLRHSITDDELALLRRHRYLVAANYFNSEDTIAEALPHLLAVFEVLGAESTAMSVYESGSTDGSHELLRLMKRTLDAAGVRNRIVMDPEPDWRISVCPSIGRNCSLETCPQLRRCDSAIRIPVMAEIRNRALAPLFDDAFMPPVPQSRGSEGDAAGRGAEDDDWGGSPPTRVVFLNDIYFTAADVITLLLTRSMQYDMACATDFGGLQLYDTWVARDITGAPMSPWYPFVVEPRSQALVKQGRPFPVYSCWNGMVVLNGDAMRRYSITFRGWVEGEPTMPVVPAGRDVAAEWKQFAGREVPSFTRHGCAVSECQLVCKDLWQAGHGRIVMNPAVKVVYERETMFRQAVLMGPWNAAVHALGLGVWRSRSDQELVDTALRTLPSAQPLRSSYEDGGGRPVDSVWELSEMAPPLSVTCGLQ